MILMNRYPFFSKGWKCFISWGAVTHWIILFDISLVLKANILRLFWKCLKLCKYKHWSAYSKWLMHICQPQKECNRMFSHLKMLKLWTWFSLHNMYQRTRIFKQVESKINLTICMQLSASKNNNTQHMMHLKCYMWMLHCTVACWILTGCTLCLVLLFLDILKGAQSYLFNFFPTFGDFDITKKAHIFLITHVKFHGWKVLHLDNINEKVSGYGNHNH